MGDTVGPVFRDNDVVVWTQVLFHYWAFSDRVMAASFSLWSSSFHRAFFSMFWPDNDSCLPAACHTETTYGLDLKITKVMGYTVYCICPEIQREQHLDWDFFWNQITLKQSYNHECKVECKAQFSLCLNLDLFYTHTLDNNQENQLRVGPKMSLFTHAANDRKLSVCN